jgi:hypothetical protein
VTQTAVPAADNGTAVQFCTGAPLLENSTVPVAPVGLTLAVRLTAERGVAGLGEMVRAVVVALATATESTVVVPVEPAM